jgi:hypothetical protein
MLGRPKQTSCFKFAETHLALGSKGWVPSKQYDEIKKHGGKLKADALEIADS